MKFLSTNHLPKVKRLAKSQGYQFIGVSLPSVSDSVGKKSANNVGFSWKSNNRRVASLELLNRDISVHQPAVLFVVGRKIHRRTFTGVRGAKEWKRIFLKIESDLL